MDGLNTFVRGINYGGDPNSATSTGAVTLAGINNQEFTGAITAQATATFTTLQDSNNSNFTLASGAHGDDQRHPQNRQRGGRRHH